jgi:hypothetical protein
MQKKKLKKKFHEQKKFRTFYLELFLKLFFLNFFFWNLKKKVLKSFSREIILYREGEIREDK